MRETDGGPALRITGLTVRSPGRQPLHDLHLQIAAGEAVGLLGGPGGGKSHLLSYVLGLRGSRRGRVRVFGHRAGSEAARQLLGSAPQHSVLPRFLTVGEVLDVVGRHYPDPVPTADLADRFGLTALLKQPTSALSAAQQRQVTVALAFVGRPRLVVLDEPTAGLDRNASARIREIVQDAHRQGTTVLVATREPTEAAALADRVLLLRAGLLRFEGAREQLLRRVGISEVSFRTDSPGRVGELASAVRTCAGGPDLVAVATNDVDRLLSELAGRRISATDISVRSVSLREVESLLAEPSVGVRA